MAQLKKELTLFGLTAVAVGACIGSGIFATPYDIANAVPSGGLMLIVWGVGGLVAVTGALTFAELGGRFPHSGGVYCYLKKAYGDLMAFLYGWVILTVVTSGAIAALSLIFARYLNELVYLGKTGQLLAGIGAIIFVSILNIYRAKFGELFSSVFTLLKLIGIGMIILFGSYYLISVMPEVDYTIPAVNQPIWGGVGVALIGVLWSYGGWHHASYLAAETPNAQRIIPRAMIIGAIIVTVTYVLTNWAYLQLLSIEEIRSSKAVAANALKKISNSAGLLVAALIALSTFGSVGVFTLSAPRIYFTMAKDGVFFRQLAHVHPTFKTPANAIMLQSGWAIVLLLFWGTFEQLMTYVLFMDWIFMTFAAISIFIFRKQKRGAPGHVKTLGYPFTPIIFIAISSWFLVATLIARPVQTIAGLILLGVGLPIYWFNRKMGSD